MPYVQKKAGSIAPLEESGEKYIRQQKKKKGKIPIFFGTNHSR